MCISNQYKLLYFSCSNRSAVPLVNDIPLKLTQKQAFELIFDSTTHLSQTSKHDEELRASAAY